MPVVVLNKSNAFGLFRTKAELDIKKAEETTDDDDKDYDPDEVLDDGEMIDADVDAEDAAEEGSYDDFE